MIRLQNDGTSSNGKPGDYGERVTNSDPMSPESLLAVIWRGRWWVLICTVLAIAGGFALIFHATPKFLSTSRVYVEQSGPKIMSDEEVGIMTQSKNYLYTQAELMKSVPIIRASLEKGNIKKCRTFQDIDGDVVEFFQKNLTVDVGKKDDILSVAFLSPYPVEAAEITNALVDSYVTFHANLKKNSSGEILKILQAEQVVLDKELNDSLNAMAEFKHKNEALALEGEKGNIVYARLDRLSKALTEARLETMNAQSYYKTLQEVAKDPESLQLFAQNRSKIFSREQRYSGNQWLADQRQAQLESQLIHLQLQRTNLISTRKENHPSVILLDKEIKDVEAEMAEEMNAVAESLMVVSKQRYDEAVEVETELEAEFAEHRAKALELNDQISKFAILQAQYDRSLEQFDTLNDRIRELNLAEDTGALNITILEFAQPEDKPAEPQKARILAMATVLGLMLGGGLALLRDMADHRIRTVDEAINIMGVPMLGTVPALKRNATPVERGTFVHVPSSSVAAEAYRAIRTSVFFSVPQDQARVIQITSSMQGEGKSTLASNLAITIAQSGQRILIVDGDFRRPVQHKHFGCKKGPGLSDVLVQNRNYASIIQKDAATGVEVLTCGTDVPNPSELLGCDAMHDLLEQLTTVYDRVIIDSPPILPVTDGCVLAATCDASIVVLRSEKTRRHALRQTRMALESLNTNILGLVVNDISRQKSRSGYYGNYGYGYGYGYSYKRDKDSSDMDTSRERMKPIDIKEVPKRVKKNGKTSIDSPRKDTIA